MTSTETVALADRFIHALHALDRDGEAAVPPMAALFAHDATIENAALALADDERHGSEAVEAFWIGYAHAMRGAQTEFHAVTTGERAIGLFWTTTRPAESGSGDKPLFYEGATWLRVGESGEVAAMRGYYDTRALDASGG